MKKYFVILSISVLFIACGRVGDEDRLTISGVPVASSGNIMFDVRSKSQLVTKNGTNYDDKGHYSMLVQSKDKNDNPIGYLSDFTYELFENGSKSSQGESKVIFNEDTRPTTNKILLLLDFSGSLIGDCDRVNSFENENNLCYQLIESAKQFIDDTVTQKQTMAIYYFNSKKNIMPLSDTATPTSDKIKLKNGLSKLYDSKFRADYLEGYNSTNLNGAVIEATKIACLWVGCNDGVYQPVNDANFESFEFASIVVFTDGRDLAKRIDKIDMLNFISKYEDLYYYSIGLGDVDTNTLKSIGRDRYIPVKQNSDLDGAFDDLSIQIKSWGESFYKVDYCPASQEGSVDIKIEVENDNYYGVISDIIKLPENIDFRCDL